jgi:hypothetical protein
MQDQRRNLPKQKTRKQNEDVASRTRSKFGHTDQNVADQNNKAYVIQVAKKCFSIL